VSTHSLYQWIKRYSPAAGDQASHLANKDQEIRQLKAELRRVTEERDILKKAARYFARASE
jgi:transposase